MTTTTQRFEIQRIYTKDISFESPNAPKVFLETQWSPEISVDLNIEHKNVDNDIYEIQLSVTVTAKAKDTTAFLVEIKQAGIFAIAGFTEEQMQHMFNAFCPNILFPFARETISDLVTRASFPQLLLAPINFDALYKQQQDQTDKAKKESKDKEKH